MCDEERRYARTISSGHVAQIYRCTQEAKGAITKMAKYAEQMITITRNHMQAALEKASNKTNEMEATLPNRNQSRNTDKYITLIFIETNEILYM